MDMAMKLYDERQIGIQEGKQKESRDNAQMIAQKLKDKGMTNGEIRNELLDFFADKLPEKEIARIVDSIK